MENIFKENEKVAKNDHVALLIRETESKIIENINEYMGYGGISMTSDFLFDMYTQYLQNKKDDTEVEMPDYGFEILFLIKTLVSIYELNERRNAFIEDLTQYNI